MISKKELLQKSRLYAIIDPEVLGAKDIAEAVKETLRGGADIIQYRDKKASDALFKENALLIKRIAKDRTNIFLINDRVELAREIDADGVHIGLSDMDPFSTREMLGPDKIIGLTTHCLAEINAAPTECTDYIAIGPIFSTKTKPDLEPLGIEEVTKIIPFISLPFS